MSILASTTHPPLIDNFGRRVSYLRLSVTDRCNLRCTYCMAEEMEFLPKANILTLEEMERVARVFVQLGVTKIRLTGGEPLVRQGIVDLCKKISGLPGLHELVMTTNGILLEEYAQSLAQAGVSRLNISLDTLKADRFHTISRVGKLQQVLSGIEAARLSGFKKIKLNAVILAGVNDDEVIDLTTFALDQGFDISFIEEMPLGEISSHQRQDTQVSSEQIRSRLSNCYRLLPSSENSGGPARYYKAEGYSARIGFISPLSHNFCGSCNRVRLTTEGRLLLCLGNEHSVDLRQILRTVTGTDDILREAIIAAMDLKPERHYFDPNRTDIVRFMSATGG